jgi:hypothetical protein
MPLTDATPAPAPPGAPVDAVDALHDAPTPAPVAAFLHTLRRVPIAAWDRCAAGFTGAALGADPLLPPAATPGAAPAAAGAAPAAWEHLAAAIDTMPGVAARIRQRVDDHLAACEGIATAAATARMRAAAHLAAAALAARPLLSEREFDAFYAPFAGLIPPARAELA